VKDLDHYGKVIRSYAGTGKLQDSDGSTAHGAFQCAQFADGRILCQLSLEEPIDSEKLQVFTSLAGTTSEGRSIEAKHLQFTRASWKIPFEYVVTFLARELYVRSPRSAPATQVQFAITNFDFLGVEPHIEPLPDGRQRGGLQLRWTLDGREVIVRRIRDYGDVLRMIKATRGIDLTATAWVSPVTEHDIDEVTQLTDDLCMLLSLARGSRIQWLCWDALSNDGYIVSSYHRDSVTRPYSSLYLIPSNPPRHTHYFLEKCFDSYRRQKRPWQLEQAIASYVDAKSAFDYLESMGLKMAVVMELVRSCYLELTGKVHIIDDGVFKSEQGELKGRVKEVLRVVFPGVSNSQIETMENHVQGMNWYPFRRSLREMFRYFGLTVSSKELQRFVDTRNELVHRARYASTAPWKEYVMMMTLVGKALLAILEYDGYYYDWTKHSGRVGSDSPMAVKMEYKHEGDG